MRPSHTTAIVLLSAVALLLTKLSTASQQIPKGAEHGN